MRDSNNSKKYLMYSTRVPTPQGKQKKWRMVFPDSQGKDREFENFGKTHGKHREI